MGRKTRIMAALLCTSALALPAAQGQETSREDLEDRVRRLEALVEQLADQLAAERRATRQQQQSDEAPDSMAPVDETERLAEAEAKVQEVDEQVAQVSEQLESMSQFFEREREPGFSIGDTQVTFGGYVKLDTIVAAYSNGAPPGSSPGRDFYIPSTIPVAPGAASQTVFDFNPRETRFQFETETPLGAHTLTSHIEFDFLVTSNDNELVSNSFTPRMRQAYLTYRGFLFGQAWSTFQNVSALPENLDFIGPTEGTVFNRQPMIRYTRGAFEVALENPETTVTSGTSGRIVADADNLPDLTARYTHKTALGDIKLAGIVRQLRLGEGTAVAGAGPDGTAIVLEEAETALGVGASLSGRLKVGERDDVRFMANVGQGLARYMGVALVNGAAVEEDGSLDPIFLYSGFASYRHFWNKRWRSNATVGFFRAHNPVERTGFGVTDRTYSAHVNLLYSPIPKLTLGLEYVYANRRIESGDAADMNRFQFSARYGF